MLRSPSSLKLKTPMDLSICQTQNLGWKTKKISTDVSFTSVLTSNRVALNLAVQHDQYRVCCAPQTEGKISVAVLLIII